MSRRQESIASAKKKLGAVRRELRDPCPALQKRYKPAPLLWAAQAQNRDAVPAVHSVPVYGTAGARCLSPDRKKG